MTRSPPKARTGLSGGVRAWFLPGAMQLSSLASLVGSVWALVFLGGCAGGGRRELPSGAMIVGTPAGGAVRDGGGPPPVTVSRLGGYLGTGYLLTDQDNSGSGQKRTEHLLEEEFGLGLTGAVISPEFLEYEATGIAGLREDWADDRLGSEFDLGEFYEADVSASLFQHRFHPALLSFSRVDDIQPQVFFNQVETSSMTARGTQSFISERGTLRFEAARRDVKYTSFETDVSPFADFTETTLGASAEARLTARQALALSYNYQDVDEQLGGRSFTAHRTIGSHRWTLDDDGSNSLRSRLETNFQDGAENQNLLRLTEDFRSEITENLEGDIGVRAERNETDFFDLELLGADARLSHRLFESLSSTLGVRGDRQISSGQSTTDTAGVDGGINYRKDTPWGRLTASYTASFERRVVAGERGGAVDEPHTFPGAPPDEVVLAQPRVDTATIVVRDPSGLVFYREGVDYRVEVRGAGVTVLVRIFTGAIPLGGDILVDYAFNSGADFTLDTVGQTARVEHEFTSGLAPYFAYQLQDQAVLDEVPSGSVEGVDERSLIGGIEWRQPDYRLGIEYENRASTVLPFEAVRFRAQLTRRFGERNYLTGNATQAFLYYDEPVRDVYITQGNARWRTLLTRRSSFYVDGALRYDNDSEFGASLGYSLSGGVEYAWRRFLFRLRFAHRETFGVTNDYRLDEVGIYIVRNFGKLPTTTRAAMDRFLQQ